MTQEEAGSEVFLGPTGSETEEFYCFQRSNPGLEKSEYLDWFQKRFNKEIELRRRRSDQPSDLEFMVIKKRSKYRERIGEESAELVRHSEMFPQKTYRELAEWFQDRFGKEIDITAISRAIKRNRQEVEAAEEHPPHPDQAPPSAKRSRRSLGSSSNGHSAQQTPNAVGSTPTFSVDMSGNPPSRQHTPTFTPGPTPKSVNSKLPAPEESGRSQLQLYQQHPHPGHPHPPVPQPLYQAMPPMAHASSNGSPTGDHRPPGPMWTAVNPSPGAAPTPVSNVYDPRSEQQQHPQHGQAQQQQHQQQQKIHAQAQQQQQAAQQQQQAAQQQQQAAQQQAAHQQAAHQQAAQQQAAQQQVAQQQAVQQQAAQLQQAAHHHQQQQLVQQQQQHHHHQQQQHQQQQVDVRSPGLQQPPPLLNHPRSLRSKSITQVSPPMQPHGMAPVAPLLPRVGFQSVPDPHSAPAAPPMAPRSYSPRRETAMHLQARLTGAIDKHQRSMDEIKACQAEMAGLLDERSHIDQRWHEEHQKVLLERDRLRSNNDKMRVWGEDLQRGNLELQEFKVKYHAAHDHITHVEEENRHLREELSSVQHIRNRLTDRESQLANARKALRENGFDQHGERSLSVGAGERRSRKELDDWVMDRFMAGSKHEEELKRLVDQVEGAGWKDLNGKLHTLKAYLNEMNKERGIKQKEWKRYIGRVYGSQSPSLEDSGMDDAGADADDEGDGNDVVKIAEKDTTPLKPLSPVSSEHPSRRGTPSVTTKMETSE